MLLNHRVTTVLLGLTQLFETRLGDSLFFWWLPINCLFLLWALSDKRTCLVLRLLPPYTYNPSLNCLQPKSLPILRALVVWNIFLSIKSAGSSIQGLCSSRLPLVLFHFILLAFKVSELSLKWELGTEISLSGETLWWFEWK